MATFLLFIIVILNTMAIFEFFEKLENLKDELKKDISSQKIMTKNLDSALSKQKEFNDYVIGYIHRQNEQELEEAIEATEEDILAGNFYCHTPEEHFKELDKEEKDRQIKIAKAIMEKRKEVLRCLDD